MKNEDQRDLGYIVDDLLYLLRHELDASNKNKLSGMISRTVQILARNVNTGTKKAAIKEATKKP